MIVGVVTFLWPGLTEFVLVFLIALRALIAGLAEVVSAASIGGHDSGVWLTAAVGVLSIVVGTLLLIYPGTGILAVVWAIGLYAIASGAVSINRGWHGALAHV